MGVKLRRQINKHSISLWLDIHNKGRLPPEFLEIHLIKNPKTLEDKQKNKENLALAESICANRVKDITFGGHGEKSKIYQSVRIAPYFEQKRKEYANKDFRKVDAGITYFQSYLGLNAIFKDVNENTIQGFANYLKKELASDTARAYFNKVRSMFEAAVIDGLMKYDVRTFKLKRGTFKVDRDRVTKELLDLEEVDQLMTAYCGNEKVRRAFIVSLNTCIDFATVSNLYGYMIDNDQIKFDRSKTELQNYIPLNAIALEAIGEITDPDTKIFNLPTWDACVKDIRNWAKRAGIKKDITWHSARHSGATNLHELGVDIVTIQKILGHKDIRQTMKYVRVKDKAKREAVDRLVRRKPV